MIAMWTALVMLARALTLSVFAAQRSVYLRDSTFDKLLTSDVAWSRTVTTPTSCARLCVQDAQCESYFHHEQQQHCHGVTTSHPVPTGSEVGVDGYKYYKLTASSATTTSPTQPTTTTNPPPPPTMTVTSTTTASATTTTTTQPPPTTTTIPATTTAPATTTTTQPPTTTTIPATTTTSATTTTTTQPPTTTTIPATTSADICGGAGYQLYLPSLQLCYHFSVARFSWQEAVTECEATGGTLAIIHTLTEFQFIDNAMKTSGGDICFNNSVDYWIGGNYNTSVTDYVWLDGVSMTTGDYPNQWASGAPKFSNRCPTVACQSGVPVDYHEWPCAASQHMICQKTSPVI